MARTVTLLSTAAALVAAMVAGSTAAMAEHRDGYYYGPSRGYYQAPPPWAPAHGWRRKHRHEFYAERSPYPGRGRYAPPAYYGPYGNAYGGVYKPNIQGPVIVHGPVIDR